MSVLLLAQDQGQMRRDGRYRLGYQLGNANVLEIHGVGGKHHGRIVDFPQTRRSIAPSIRQTQRGTGDAVVQVDPGVHQRILFSNIVHLFRSTSADIVVTARGEQLCALSCDRIELKCTVRVQKVTAVLPDELACDALWFPRCGMQAQRRRAGQRTKPPSGLLLCVCVCFLQARNNLRFGVTRYFANSQKPSRVKL